MPRPEVLFLFLLFAVSCSPAPHAPNVLLVTVDCLRADRAEAGRPIPDVNPNVSRFLAEAASFRRALTSSPWTLPSLTTLMRSRYPIEHGAIGANARNVVARPAPGRTLAAVLAEHGYRTGAFLAHGVVLEPERHIVAGFADRNPGLPASFSGKLTAPEIERAFRRWVRKKPEQPFFAWLHYMELHAPPTKGNPHLSRIRPPYDAEMRYVDDSFGRIRRSLERLGEWERTIVILTSDHGEELGDHLAGGHQHTLFDELIRIPLAIRFPGGRHAGVVDGQIELLDVAPTLLEALDLEPEPAFRGRSRLGWIRGEPVTPEPSFAARYFCRGHHLVSTSLDGWKLIGFVPCEGVRSWRASTHRPSPFPETVALDEVVPVADGAAPHRLDWRFGDEIGLAGYDVRRSRVAEDAIYLDLFWRAGPALTSVPERTVFLRGPNGDGRETRSLVADGDLPVHAWREGTVVRETLWLQAPEEFDVILRSVVRRDADGRAVERLRETDGGRDRDFVLGRHALDGIAFVDGAASAEEALAAARDRARRWSPDDPGIVWKLYDLRADPGERTNLYWTHPERAAGLKAALAALQRRHAAEASPAAADAALSGEQEQRLRSLGYLQ